MAITINHQTNDISATSGSLTIDGAAGYPVVQVRTATIIAEDDVEISRTFHRHVLTPDADLSGEDADVVAIAGTVFTDAAKAAYAAASAQE